MCVPSLFRCRSVCQWVHPSAFCFFYSSWRLSVLDQIQKQWPMLKEQTHTLPLLLSSIVKHFSCRILLLFLLFLLLLVPGYPTKPERFSKLWVKWSSAVKEALRISVPLTPSSSCTYSFPSVLDQLPFHLLLSPAVPHFAVLLFVCPLKPFSSMLRLASILHTQRKDLSVHITGKLCCPLNCEGGTCCLLSGIHW